MRLSGLQKDVLSLYRKCLRESRKKPVVRVFSINIDKRDFAVIEFLLRKGHRQLEMYSAPGIKDIR
ncbi:hypothetical protein K445DRAFT_63424 [Daldinia sp. EC12]|nr:hypothetical protein K445DRAFT_63424 [Daldinia sp. EC12]